MATRRFSLVSQRDAPPRIQMAFPKAIWIWQVHAVQSGIAYAANARDCEQSDRIVSAFAKATGLLGPSRGLIIFWVECVMDSSTQPHIEPGN